MKKIIFLLVVLFPLNLFAGEKVTTVDAKIFNQAQSDGKTVVVTSWIKYCTSCASQMKALNDVEYKILTNRTKKVLINLIIISFNN